MAAGTSAPVKRTREWRSIDGTKTLIHRETGAEDVLMSDGTSLAEYIAALEARIAALENA